MSSSLFGNEDLEDALERQEEEKLKLEEEQARLEEEKRIKEEQAHKQTVTLRRAGTGGGTTNDLSNTLG